MNIRLSYTSFRNILRPLSVYSEKSRGKGIAAKIKWVCNENVRMYGYDSPNHQTRLSIVRLDSDTLGNSSKAHYDFLTEVPVVRGLSSIARKKKINIDTEAEQPDLRISTKNFRYNIKKGSKTQDMDIKNRYLPMEQIKAKATVSSNILKKFFHLTLEGPIELHTHNKNLRIVAKTDTDKISLDLDGEVTINSGEEITKRFYDRSVISEMVRKFPSNKKVKIAVNNDLIRLQYRIGDNLGCVDYYQRGRVSR